MTDFPSEAAINEALDNIFARPEFRSYMNELLARVYHWLVDLFVSFYTGNFDIIPLAIFTIFLLLLIFGMMLLARASLRRRHLSEPQSALKEESCDDPWLASIDYAEKGLFEKAIVFLFIWYLQFLASGNFITIEKGKTNIQYELELKQNAYGKIDRFRAFKTVFAAVRYGGRDINGDDFESWRMFCLEARAS